MKKSLFITTLVLGGLFLGMLLVMHFDPGDFSYIDAMATAVAHHITTWHAIEPFIILTTVGDVMSIILLTLLCAFLLRRTPRYVFCLVLATIGQALSVQGIKLLIERVRPDTLYWIGPLYSYSFPSGHSASIVTITSFFVLWVFLTYRSRLVRSLSILLGVFLVLGVGASRIILAAHFASDVLAGYLLGGFWVAFTLTLSYVFVSKNRQRRSV